MFHECRARAVQQGFVDYAQLRSALAAREIADHRTVRGMLDGLERMLRGINLAVEAAFATYILLTLKDLEGLIISTSQDFHGIDSFDALMLGPLAKHPVVRRHMPHAAPEAAVTTEEVVTFLCGSILKRRRADSEESPAVFIAAALDVLAHERGLQSGAELGVFVRAESFVIYLTNKIKTQSNRSKHASDKQVGAVLKRSAPSADADQDGATSVDARPRLPPPPTISDRLRKVETPVQIGTLIELLMGQTEVLTLPGLHSSIRAGIHKHIERCPGWFSVSTGPKFQEEIENRVIHIFPSGEGSTTQPLSLARAPTRAASLHIRLHHHLQRQNSRRR